MKVGEDGGTGEVLAWGGCGGHCGGRWRVVVVDVEDTEEGGESLLWSKQEERRWWILGALVM